jgi:hypothetical protein|tara:strand:+ start:271 stop:1014 length:744 start_codon:yes stop_codon:yes gene_type:complete
MQAEQNNFNNVTKLPQFIKPYKLKNLLLANPADWFIEEKTLELAKSSLPDLIDFYKSEGVEDPKELSLKLIIEEPVKDVYNVPLFSDVFCKLMMDEIENMQKHFSFSPNPDEDQLRQIPEIVLNEITPDLYNSLMNVVFSVVNPIFLTLWNRHVTGGGIQIANYNLKDKKQGAWHHDASADISMVVPLNTGDYVGGGTEFLNRGVVKPLPKGNALIFPSYTHLHRGLPVQSGNRYLLVFWLTTEREI